MRSSGFGVGPKSSDRCYHKKRGLTESHSVRTGAEIGVLQVEQCSGPHGHQKPEETRKDPFLEPAQVAGPCQHLDLGPLWPPDLETHFCCLSLRPAALCLGSPGSTGRGKGKLGPGLPALEPSSYHLSHSQGPYFSLSGQYGGTLPSTHYSHSSSGPRSANGLKDSPAHEVHRYDLNLLSLKFSFP